MTLHAERAWHAYGQLTPVSRSDHGGGTDPKAHFYYFELMRIVVAASTDNSLQLLVSWQLVAGQANFRLYLFGSGILFLEPILDDTSNETGFDAENTMIQP